MSISVRVRKSKIRLSFGDIIYINFIRVFLLLFTAITLYPLIYVLSCSFSSADALVAGKVFFLPVNPSLMGYIAVFHYSKVWLGYYNTIIYTTAGTVIGICVTMIGSFVLSRKEFSFNKALTALLMFTLFFSGGIIPLYLLIKNLGMIDKIWAIILPGAFSVWLAIIGRTFIKGTIPEELYEATSLDGGSYFQFFIRIVLPLSKPILAVFALNFAVGQWNSYFNALMFLNDTDKYPLQIILREILVLNTVDQTNLATDVKYIMQKQYMSELLRYSLIVVSSVPMLILYPFIQKYFIKGVMIGSLKG